MGVDYQARKAAKKNRRRSEELKPRRERKKKQARRLCRGPCYQEPGLRPEDLDDGAGGSGPAAGGEMARSLASLGFGGGGSAPAADPAGKPGSKRKAAGEGRTAAKLKAKPSGVKVAEDGEGGSRATKKPRMSTAVSLLDAKTAKTEAPRQKGLALEAVSGQLAQFPELLQRFMAGEGFAEPMPIQTKCWPLVLAGRDVEALAEPGSGKTLAYLLPAAVLLASKGHGADSRPDGPLALILLPTRELAQQVAATCRDLRKYSGLRSLCITGGADKGQQQEALSKQPHIVVATPGRLLDLVQDGSLQLGRVRYVVLDEADKMLGLGFQPQIEALRALLLPPAGGAAAGQGKEGGKAAKKKGAVQVGLYTATMPESLAHEAAQWLHRPERVRISASAASISKSVAQVVQVCAEHKKAAKLQKHLERIRAGAQGMRNPPRILIFANRIKTVRFLHNLVEEAGFRAALLHGERSQDEREAAVADFRSGKAQVLVATDVAARGLHIRNLPYVVNYDFPPNLEQYIHRVGRTGRLATDGHAFSFFTREMARLAPPVVELLEAHGQAVDPNLVKLAEAFRIAAEKLGLLADATGEAPAQPDRDDVLRSLGLKTQQQKKKERQAAKRQQKKGGAPAGSESEDASGSEEGEEEEEQQGRPQHGDQQAPAGQAQQAQPAAAAQQQQQRRQLPPDELEPVAFIPSKTFSGARPSMVFKKGPRGLGYYLDVVQQRREQQQQQAGGKRKGKGADAAKAAQKAEWQALKVKYSHAPIGGKGADHDKPAAGRKARQEQAAAQQAAPKAAAAAKPAAAAPMLPGRLKELKRQRQLAAAAGQLEGFSDSDDEGPAAAAPSKRHKALPGRLRKKLAKQKAGGGRG